MPAQLRRHWLLLTLILVATFVVRLRLGASPIVPLRQSLDRFPAQVGTWHLTDQPALSADVLSVLKADDYMIRDFAADNGRQAQLFVAYYRTQHAGDSMHSPKNCLPGSGFAPILSDQVPLAAGGPGAMINRYVVEKGGDRDMVLYWYQAQGRIIASEYWGKLYLVWDAMREGRRDGAIVRVLVPMGSNDTVAGATERALSLANPSLPLLSNFLPR
ncbi:MAG: exosortase C-terminal domain/associated protein EpsI [Terriglobales bacterium]